MRIFWRELPFRDAVHVIIIRAHVGLLWHTNCILKRNDGLRCVSFTGRMQLGLEMIKFSLR